MPIFVVFIGDELQLPQGIFIWYAKFTTLPVLIFGGSEIVLCFHLSLEFIICFICDLQVVAKLVIIMNRFLSILASRNLGHKSSSFHVF